ncbi:MAG: hypothetical protein U1F77_07080 [Kiritimatiellia bacterium]
MEQAPKDHLFMGSFRHALDPKKRFTIPSEWREELAPETRVVVLPAFDKPCLMMLPQSEVRRRVRESMGSRSVVDARSQQLARMVGPESCNAEWDSQGRIRIRDELLEEAGLKSEIVMLGVLSGIELWSPENWAATKAGFTPEGRADAAKEIGF